MMMMEEKRTEGTEMEKQNEEEEEEGKWRMKSEELNARKGEDAGGRHY